jgi:hypothetical protein
MHCEYNVTYKDFLASMKSYRKVARGAALVYYIDVWILPFVGACMALFVLITLLLGDKATANSLWWFAGLGAVLFVVLPGIYWLKLRQVYRQRIAISDRGFVIFSFDENEVRFVLPDRADVRYPWPVFTRFIETDQVGTLFLKKAAFHTIPKRAMKDVEWEEFRGLVRKHGVKT